jgi:hypothetical protein
LPEALDRLEASDGALEALLWGEVLVPFVAHFFVRGVDFGARFAARWTPVLDAERASPEGELGLTDLALSHNNVNRARLFEFMRLLSPVMRARWRLLRCGEGQERFVMSNLGYAPLRLSQSDGCVIPIGGMSAIHLEPRPRTPRIFFGDTAHGWLIDVEPVSVRPAVVRRVNRAIARHAPSQVYGESTEAVLSVRREMAPRTPRVAELIWDDSRALRRNQLELLRFLQVVVSPPDRPQLSFDQALEVMRYPAPVPLQANPEAGTGLSPEEEATIAAAEQHELAREHHRLRDLFSLSADLEEVVPPA